MTEDKTTPRVSKWIPLLAIVPFLLITMVMLVGQSHFKFSEAIAGKFSLPKGVRTIKIVTDVGNVELLIGSPGQLEFEGKTLRATGTQEDIDRATAVPFTMETVPSDDPTVFVVRVSPMPEGFLRLPPRKDDEEDQETPRLVRQMDVRMRVPVDLEVDLESSEGNIRVETRQAPISVKVEKGSLMLQNIVGALTVVNGEGDTIIDAHRGPLKVRGNGKTRVRIAELIASIDVVNDLSELDVVLPPHCSATIDAKSTTGNVRNGFGFEREAAGEGSVTKGKLGEGTHLVRLIARKGTLTITAAKE